MCADHQKKVHTDAWQIARHVTTLESSIIREILKISSRPGVINFAGGLPDPALFPLEDMKWAMAQAIEEFGPEAVQYSLSAGITPLRKLIAERATARGTKTSAENIQITAGGQQGIELVARAFIEPGDYILTENPTYVGALQAFNYYRARYCAAEMDGEGMIIDRVRKCLDRYRPKLIYTVSNFQNPTGITMSEQRRRELLDLAMSRNIPIIDDNPYSDIRFTGAPVPTLKSLGGDEVVALRTFSKVLAPGLRVGWINGPADIMVHFEKVKQCTDLHTNTLCQAMIYEYVKAGKLEPHI
ncbi:MAG TPA: PLP-dependent aminotransferase family protein, partial [candidate division Zixibacteria bacterium]|nr:PLP-dependent aminotransferase family protein [candidate division Zixibacteria bacterium]